MTEKTPLPIPYPADTRAKGWRFELDHERIRQSDTWALAPADLRPWLLMLWMTAWEQMPCGSLPTDDDLIAARIGMSTKLFAKHRAVLLRGWWKAEDGRLYHNIITQRVTEMLSTKDKERTRKAAYRQRMDAERSRESQGSPQMSHGTDVGREWDYHGSDPGRDDTGTGTGTGTGFIKNQNLSVPDGTDADASQGLTPHEAIFQIGLPWIVSNAGSDIKEANIRSMLGGAEKHLKPEGAWQLVQDCMRVKPFEPVAWLASAINERKKVAAKGGNGNRQEALEARNNEVARRWANGGSA